jgi:hypothetical protein
VVCVFQARAPPIRNDAVAADKGPNQMNSNHQIVDGCTLQRAAARRLRMETRMSAS